MYFLQNLQNDSSSKSGISETTIIVLCVCGAFCLIAVVVAVVLKTRRKTEVSLIEKKAHELPVVGETNQLVDNN